MSYAFRWNGGAKRQRALLQHSALPLAAFQKEFIVKCGSGSRRVGMLDLSWRRGKRTSTYGAAAKLVMRILTCLFIYLTRTQEAE